MPKSNPAKTGETDIFGDIVADATKLTELIVNYVPIQGQDHVGREYLCLEGEWIGRENDDDPWNEDLRPSAVITYLVYRRVREAITRLERLLPFAVSNLACSLTPRD